jgi:hypothetical protein
MPAPLPLVISGILLNRTWKNVVESEDVSDSLPITSGNDTNEDELFYFARMSNHYLQLVKSSHGSSSNNHHLLDYHTSHATVGLHRYSASHMYK